MRSPQIVLENLQKKSLKKDYQFKRLYRNLYNPDFYILAYQNLYTNKGAMTPGVDGLTLDGVGVKRIESIIQSLKDHSYQPQPARRRYISKKSGKGQRPLGIPSANDKLVQEVVRMLLENIYEPTFSKFSHGFRPNRSCHTALAQVQKNFMGIKWFVEGDIKAYFDTIDHHTLINILRRRIKDELLIALLWKFLKAGYMEDWRFNTTYSGTPQGSGLSPLLANIYLHELDMYMEEYKRQFDRGQTRTTSKDYEHAHNMYHRRKRKYDVLWPTLTGDEKKAAQKEIKALRKQFQQYPAKDPMDENYRRKIQYVRYVDDFLVGVIGSKADAEKTKADIGRFLSEKLKLAMSQEKTLITNGQNKARFLGYDITICQNTATKRTSRGQTRVYNNRVKLFVPKEKWVGKLLEYGVLKITTNENGKEIWKPLQRNDFMGLEPREIVSMYNAQIRGMYNYYRLANNASVFNKLYYVMEYSMFKTFAGKFNITVAQAKTKYMRDGVVSVEYMTKTGPRRITFYNGGFSRIKAPLTADIDCKPESVNHKPRELFFRIKAAKCELCGNEQTPVSVHQVKCLKDLSGNLPWERVMMKMRRKTLIVCEECHQSIHNAL
ncbi:MAG: reverse transcriptase domain-containing protein [Bacillota bacterium]